MKEKYQMMKIPSRNKQTLLTFHHGTRYQDENVCLPKRHVIGIKNQLKTTNVKKHIGLFPQDLCIIYDLAFEYKNAHKWDHHSPHILFKH